MSNTNIYVLLLEKGKYYIGKSNPEDSYLNQDIIIRAARELKADAIHPGYGFLSENIEFAKRCKKEKIISLQFIQIKHQFLLVLFLCFLFYKLYATFTT